MKRRSQVRAGYTMVEVMMGLAVLAVGSVAIISLQRFAVLGTMASRHLTNATNLTASTIEQMKQESGRWTDNTSSITPANMPWLGTALANDGTWVAPAFHAFRLDGTPADATTAADTDEVAYCTHVRAVFLGDPAGAGLNEADAARVEVRTFFAKSGRTIAPECRDWTGADVDALFTGTDQSALSLTRNRNEYGVVFLTTIIGRTGS